MENIFRFVTRVPVIIIRWKTVRIEGSFNQNNDEVKNAIKLHC